MGMVLVAGSLFLALAVAFKLTGQQKGAWWSLAIAGIIALTSFVLTVSR